MASRGTRKGGTHRMDGAIAALTPLGFSKKLIRDTIKELLQVYGDNDAGWYFVEENYYKLAIDKIIEDQDSNKEEQLEMALGDESPRRSITTMFDCNGKKLSIRPIGFIQGDQGQGQTVPPVIGVSSPPPGSEYQSSTEQGQGQTNPPVVRVPPHVGYFPTPTSTNPQFSSPDQTHLAPFYPYYPPQTSQTVPSTYPYPPYHHLYYYPPLVLPKQGGPSIEAEVGAGEPIKIEDKRVYIEPEGDTFNPARLTTHKIRDIIRGKYDAPYLSWKKIPKEVRDMWFREFQKDFRWLPEHGSRIRTNFEKRGSTRLRDMFTNIRKSGKRPLWIGVRVWDDLTRAWASPEFTILREQNKQNRASDCGGLGSSLHTGGSIPYTEHRRRLKEFLGRDPTPLELHTRTHQHQVDHQWVDEKARKAHDDFIRLRESQPSTCKGSSSRSTKYSEYHTWSQAVGGRQKGRVYGLGSQGCAIESNTSTSAFYNASGVEETVSQRVAVLTKEIEEMRQIQAEMQAEMQSYRAKNQKKNDQEPVHESQGNEDEGKASEEGRTTEASGQAVLQSEAGSSSNTGRSSMVESSAERAVRKVEECCDTVPGIELSLLSPSSVPSSISTRRPCYGWLSEDED